MGKVTEAGVAGDPAPLQHTACTRDACRQHKPCGNRTRVDTFRFGEVVVSLRRVGRIGESRLMHQNVLQWIYSWTRVFGNPGHKMILRWRALFFGTNEGQRHLGNGSNDRVPCLLESHHPPFIGRPATDYGTIQYSPQSPSPFHAQALVSRIWNDPLV